MGVVVFIIHREGQKNIYCSETLQRMLLVLVTNVEGRKGRPLGSEDGQVTASGIYECAAARQFERRGKLFALNVA